MMDKNSIDPKSLTEAHEEALDRVATHIEDRDQAGLEGALEVLADNAVGQFRATRLIADAMFLAGTNDEKREVFDLLNPRIVAELLSTPAVAGPFAKAMDAIAQPEAAAALLRSASDRAPEDVGLAFQYVRFLSRLGRDKKMREFIGDRTEVFGNPAALLTLPPGIGLTETQREVVRAYIETLDIDNPKNLRRTAVLWLYAHGLWDAGNAAARRLEVTGLGFQRVGAIVELLDSAPDIGVRAEPYEESDDVHLRHAPDSKGLVLLFGGVADVSLMSLSLIDRYLAPLGLSSLILRDNHRLVFMQGVQSLGPDRDRTITKLRSIINDIGVDRLYTLSSSAGSFGAMSYGLMLKAERCLSFSPVSLIGGVAEQDPRTTIIRERLERTLPKEEWDIIDWMKRSDHSMPMSLYYAQDNGIDSFHAERMRDEPGVSLFPIETEGKHDTLLPLAERSDFGTVIAQALGLESEDPV